MPESVAAADSNRIDGPSRGSKLIIFLTVFIDLLGFGMVMPLLPIYAEQFTDDAAGWKLGALMASFSLMQFIFAPLWGQLSDRIGRRPVIIVGLAGSVVCYTLFGIATTAKSIMWLFVARIGAGIAGATIPTAQAYIADTTTKENRTKGMALIGMAFGCGFTFGPLLGAMAVPTADAEPGPWPGYVAAGLSLVALLLAIFRLPESLPTSASSADGASERASKEPEKTGHERQWLDTSAFRYALGIPAIGMVLATIFICIFSFANFESTLSLLVFRDRQNPDATTRFQFNWQQVCWTYAFIGFTLALVQGGIVRRVSDRMSEAKLAIAGAVMEIVGFLALTWAVQSQSVLGLFAALTIITSGFSFLQPSLNAMLSRRTAANWQGAVLGLGQSISSLARIAGPAIGIRLFRLQTTVPYYTAAVLMIVGLAAIAAASRTADADEATGEPTESKPAAASDEPNNQVSTEPDGSEPETT